MRQIRARDLCRYIGVMDADGRPVCRYCGATRPANTRYRYYCAECSRLVALMWSATSQRYEVQRRDRGVCANCGVDTDRLHRIVRHAHDAAKRLRVSHNGATDSTWRSFGSILASDLGYNYCQSFWQMDHVHPVSRGGGVSSQIRSVEALMSNLQTLCVPCHREKTAAQRAQGAKR